MGRAMALPVIQHQRSSLPRAEVNCADLLTVTNLQKEQ